MFRQAATLTILIFAGILATTSVQAAPPWCPASINPCYDFIMGEETYRETIQRFCDTDSVYKVDQVFNTWYLGYYDSDGDFNEVNYFANVMRYETYDTGVSCSLTSGNESDSPPSESPPA